MGRPSATSSSERHATCRNLVWEAPSRHEEATPGRYCVNRIGVVHALDCPVYQGLACCLFDPRDEGEAPTVPGLEDLDHLRARLARDYLRWPYWKRLEVLRGSEVPAEEVEDLPEFLEPEPGTDDEEPVRVEKAEPKEEPKPVEDRPEERYPGQRRSEDRRRTRQGGESTPAPELDEDFAAGILADVPEVKPEVDEAADPEKKETSGDTEKKAGDKKRTRRRRSRRRRPRGRGGKGKKT